MKRILLFGIISSTTTAVAQPVLLKQAIIHITGTVVYKDEIVDSYTKLPASFSDDYSPRQLEFRPYKIPKRKTITYVQNDFVQTFPKTRKKYTRPTTMKTPMPQGATGSFYTNPGDENLFFSLTRSSLEWENNASKNNIEIHYTKRTKKIAGYSCKKAEVVTQDLSGNTYYCTVWYCPNIQLPGFNFIGNRELFGKFVNLTDGFENVAGFIMAYTVEPPDGSRIKIKVTKIDTTTKFDEKEF